MTDEIRQRLEKVYALVSSGATDGERAAANLALDRLMDKYNITEEQLSSIGMKEYRFKYSSKLDMYLLKRIFTVLINNEVESIFRTSYGGGKRVREIKCKLTYINWITVESAYEYFRRHMRQQWNLHCKPLLSKCRKTKTRNKMRDRLQFEFINQYCIASKLFKQHELTTSFVKEGTAGYELKSKMRNVQGGNYTQQVTNGKLIDHAQIKNKANTNTQLNLFT